MANSSNGHPGLKVISDPPTSKDASILVIADHTLVRRGLRKMLERAGCRVIGETKESDEALRQATRFRPDIIIADVTIPESAALQAMQLILKTMPGTRFLALGRAAPDAVLHAMFAAGVLGYVTIGDVEKDLEPAIHALLDGRTFFTAAILERLRHPCPRLNPRELQVIRLIAKGKTNSQAAATLGISPRTVEDHRAHIKDKLHLDTLSDLIRYAVRNELIDP